MKSLLALSLLFACKSKTEEQPAPPPLSSCPATNQAGFESLTAALQSEVASLDIPGAAVAVVQDGQIVYCQAVGVAGPQSSEPLQHTTLFRIGSQTKQLTAALISQQIDDGLLTEDTTINELYPSSVWVNDERVGSVTVHQLLSHTSGMVDYIELDGPTKKGALSSFATEFAPNNLYLNADPSVVWNYSNAGYSLAGAISEAADPKGRPWRQLIAEELFVPLDLNRTFFDKADVLEDGDFTFGDGSDFSLEYENVGPKTLDSGLSAPAGYAWSNIEDLSRWTMVLLNGAHPDLSSAAVERLLTPAINTLLVRDRHHYGWGMMIEEGFYVEGDWYSNLRWNHGGDIPGFSSDLFVLPEQNASVILLSNRSYSHLSDTADEAMRLLAGEPDPTDEPDFSFDERAQLNALVGEYEENWSVGNFTITEEEGVPTIDFPILTANQVPFEPEMVFYEPDVIIVIIQDNFLAFTITRDNSGAITHLANRAFVGEKIQGSNAKRATQHRAAPTRAEVVARLKPALYPTIEAAVAARLP